MADLLEVCMVPIVLLLGGVFDLCEVMLQEHSDGVTVIINYL